ncbi:MAG: hypothetical protein ACRC8Y_24415, partial [Chroococcales cyanobacterium]
LLSAFTGDRFNLSAYLNVLIVSPDYRSGLPNVTAPDKARGLFQISRLPEAQFYPTISIYSVPQFCSKMIAFHGLGNYVVYSVNIFLGKFVCF